jgi:hypothetical protein
MEAYVYLSKYVAGMRQVHSLHGVCMVCMGYAVTAKVSWYVHVQALCQCDGGSTPQDRSQ